MSYGAEWLVFYDQRLIGRMGSILWADWTGLRSILLADSGVSYVQIGLYLVDRLRSILYVDWDVLYGQVVGLSCW